MKEIYCETCEKSFPHRHSYAAHKRSCGKIRNEDEILQKRIAYSQKRKELYYVKNSNTVPTCKFCCKTFERGNQVSAHQLYCKDNPDRNRNLNTISNAMKGKTLSESAKDSISKGMKKAHKEGRAWNIGMSRWNNEPSYPEKFFMQVIENEFDDKEYVRERSFKKYSIDFAWEHKQIAIEIDGETHQRFESVQITDKEKDEALISEGWKIMRIPWIEMFHNTKEWIEKAKQFVHSNLDA